ACSPATNSPEDEFVLHPDFRLERVAAEPLVLDPVDMEFDEAGRAFVLEMPGYPLRDEQSRLVWLKDTDQDGRFDQRQVFAQGLNQASSIMPYRQGWLVAAPPQLLYLKDTNGDGLADERKVLMEGFSDGNLQHNYNGLTYGLDNWIYAANGGNSGKPYFTAAPQTALDMRGQDIRFRLQTQQLQRVGESSGGFELAFDHWGRMYETHNLEHVSQLVIPGRYTDGLPLRPPHALVNISDHEENGLSRIYPIGEQETRVNHPEQSGYFSGSCGITFYGGAAFPPELDAPLLVADVVLNLIHLDRLSVQGPQATASRNRPKVEFLASTDRAFRPVNLCVGPDGALYVLDMHRVVIEHPEWIPDELEVNMDLRAGKNQGRIYRIVPKSFNPQPISSLSTQSPQALVAKLEHPHQWVRMTSQRLMVERQDTAVLPHLQALAQESPSPLARMHALWTLEGLGALTPALIQAGLEDPHPGVREHAIRMAEPVLSQQPTLAQKVLQLTADPSTRVRMQAALSLSRLHGAAFTRLETDIRAALFRLLQQTQTDTWTAMAVAVAASRQPLDFSLQLASLQQWGPNQQLVGSCLGNLLGKQQQTAGIQQLLDGLTSSPLPQPQKAQLLEALATGWEESGAQASNRLPASLLTSLQKLESAGSPTLLRATAKLRASMGLPLSPLLRPQLAAARLQVQDSSLNVQLRLASLQLLALDAFKNREELLYRLLDNRQPLALQKEALAQLWAANEPEVGRKLLERWPTLGPEARKLAGNILLYKSQNHELLLTALEQGSIRPGELNFDLERRRVLLFSEDENVSKRARALFSDAGVVQRKEAIAQMHGALSLKGSPQKGKKIFETSCSTCHRYGEMGKEVGPALTEIGRKSRESLLHDILDPNAAVDTRYLNHQVRTKDGNIYTGMVAHESDTHIHLRMAGGQEVQLPKAEIQSFTSLGISLMPEGLEAGLSPEDMADLLAFLQQ
ncbi:MAG: hypothetical protein D6730_12910, partial [Bacteroidetes bacterium]